MFGSFPYEPVPDGAVFGPHHFYLGVLLILLVCWTVQSDGADGTPVGVAGLTLLATFSFALTWPYYPVVGAFGVLVLLAGATVLGLGRPFWWQHATSARIALLVGLFVAWDDALSHALGWRTPLDTVWARYLHPYASNPRVPSDLRLPVDLKSLVAQNIADAVAVIAL